MPSDKVRKERYCGMCDKWFPVRVGKECPKCGFDLSQPVVNLMDAMIGALPKPRASQPADHDQEQARAEHQGESNGQQRNCEDAPESTGRHSTSAGRSPYQSDERTESGSITEGDCSAGAYASGLEQARAFDNGSGMTEVMTPDEMIAEIQRLGKRCEELYATSEQARAEIDQARAIVNELGCSETTPLVDAVRWLADYAKRCDANASDLFLANFEALKRAQLAESLLTEARAEIERLKAELANVTEELESNRRCNLYTWKERAQLAESLLTECRAEIEKGAERDDSRRQISLVKAEGNANGGYTRIDRQYDGYWIAVGDDNSEQDVWLTAKEVTALLSSLTECRAAQAQKGDK